jgi:hypothetical protein
VFVNDQLLVDLGFGAARATFARLSSGDVLLAASEAAYGQGINGGSRLAGVQFHDLAAGEDSAGLALRWDAIGPDGGLFAALDANLTLTQAGERASLLDLAGIYRLPDTVPGQALAGPAAAATARAFLSRVAGYLICPPASVA